MKVGDLVRIKNLHPDWGSIGFVTRITAHLPNANGLGQISLFSNGGHRAIPWYKREHYLEVISAAV